MSTLTVNTNPWKKIEYSNPPQNTLLETKIEDEKGVRNEQNLTLKSNLWFGEDGMYVHYSPTHWRLIK